MHLEATFFSAIENPYDMQARNHIVIFPFNLKENGCWLQFLVCYHGIRCQQCGRCFSLILNLKLEQMSVECSFFLSFFYANFTINTSLRNFLICFLFTAFSFFFFSVFNLYYIYYVSVNFFYYFFEFFFFFVGSFINV